ncbi:MAG: S41 family peptidase [Balneolaceae bacterium]|nr:S41 family peptidase [Balneolaceae bacterium]
MAKILPDKDALYIQLNRVLENESGDFAKFVSDLPTPQSSTLSHLIIDLRTNRGGDAKLLQPLVHYIIKQWPYLKPGTIFVLTSNYTFSAAVHLAAELE